MEMNELKWNQAPGTPGERLRLVMWSLFVLAALLLLAIDNMAVWTAVVVAGGALLAAVDRLVPDTQARTDRRDLAVIAGLYVAVVGAFRLAFTVFTTDNVLGLFLAFAAGLLLGVVGPVVYQVWIRKRDLTSLGIGRNRLGRTAVLAVGFGGVQFAVTFWGFDLPAPSHWLPLLVMSLVVGFFEAVFFRGFIQGRLEAGFGPVPAVVGASLLYSLYHLGYGMGPGEMWFLFALGIVYAVAYRLTDNILVLWPLLTPVGAFFNNLTAGDIRLPWESILGFLDVAMVMGAALWLAHRHLRKALPAASRQPTTIT